MDTINIMTQNKAELELIRRNQEIAKEFALKIGEINKTTKPFNKSKIEQLNLASKEQKERELSDSRENLMLKAIGQMYNGVLIPNELTIRNGRLYPYRRRYNMSASSVKEVILKDIHEVSTKISKDNLDVLEFLLGKIEDNDDNDRYSRGYRQRNRTEATSQKEIPVKDMFVIFGEDYGDNAEFKVNEIKAIIIKDNGEISFRNKKRQDTDVDERIKGMLFTKYYSQIKIIYDGITQTFDKKLATLEAECEEIKSKCGNLLVMAKLQDEKNGINEK